jgi:hypothetical protein
MEELRSSLQSQLAENTAAVQDLDVMVKHLVSTSAVRALLPPPSKDSAAAAAALSSGWSGGAPASAEASPLSSVLSSADGDAAEVLDPEDRLLLERINHLASDLSAEMQEAVHELELQQQTLFQRHTKHLGDGPRPQGWGAASPSAASISTMLPVAARWLESRDEAQFYRGLLATVLMSCGLWTDTLWEQLEGEPMRWVRRRQGRRLHARKRAHTPARTPAHTPAGNTPARKRAHTLEGSTPAHKRAHTPAHKRARTPAHKRARAPAHKRGHARAGKRGHARAAAWRVGSSAFDTPDTLKRGCPPVPPPPQGHA